MDETPGPQPERTPPRSTAGAVIDYAAWALVIGGFLLFLGVYLKWFTISASFSGVTASASTNGTSDWTGVVAVVAGLAALGAGAAALLMSPDIGRPARLVGTIAAVAGLIVTVIAFFRANSVGLQLPGAGGANGVDATATAGLYVSFLGAVIATVGAAMSMRRLETR